MVRYGLKEKQKFMTRNECIEECVNIWNDLSLSEDKRKEQLTELLLTVEESFSKSKVSKLLKVLKTKGIPVTTTELWNEIR